MQWTSLFMAEIVRLLSPKAFYTCVGEEILGTTRLSCKDVYFPLFGGVFRIIVSWGPILGSSFLWKLYCRPGKGKFESTAVRTPAFFIPLHGSLPRRQENRCRHRTALLRMAPPGSTQNHHKQIAQLEKCSK